MFTKICNWFVSKLFGGDLDKLLQIAGGDE